MFFLGPWLSRYLFLSFCGFSSVNFGGDEAVVLLCLAILLDLMSPLFFILFGLLNRFFGLKALFSLAGFGL